MNNNVAIQLYSLFLLPITIIWVRSSIGKITGGVFVNSLEKTLEKFASGNPYGWFATLIDQVALPNIKVIGNLILWGEVFVAIGLSISVLYLLFLHPNKPTGVILAGTLVVAMLMNILFWFGSGWMSPSSDGLNLLMFLLELVAFVGIFRLDLL